MKIGDALNRSPLLGERKVKIGDALDRSLWLANERLANERLGEVKIGEDRGRAKSFTFAGE